MVWFLSMGKNQRKIHRLKTMRIQNFKETLQEWYERLRKANVDNYISRYKQLLAKIQQHPVTTSILLQAIQRQKITDDITDAYQSALDSGDSPIFSSEEQAAAQLFAFHMRLLADPETEWAMVIFEVSHYNDFNRDFPNFLENTIEPIFHYLYDQLETFNDILYLLNRYKKRVEWFEREEIIKKYNDPDKGGEAALDEHLRMFLFDQGIEQPFSSPKTPAGRADVVTFEVPFQPLILEVKIFDTAKNYGKPRIFGGYTQAAKYVDDFHQSVGYLVVFVFDDVDITVESEPGGDKNVIICGHKIIYVIFIYCSDRSSASTSEKIKHILIPSAEFTSHED